MDYKHCETQNSNCSQVHEDQALLTFMTEMKWLISLTRYFMSAPGFSSITLVLPRQSTHKKNTHTTQPIRTFHHTRQESLPARGRQADSPLGDIVEVEGELGQHGAALLILLLGPVQHLTHLSTEVRV